MKIGGLTLFKRMHSNGTPIDSVVLAGWHNPKSLTWRWSLTWGPMGNTDKRGWHYQRIYTYCPGWNFDWHLRLPLVGRLRLSTQPSMFNIK